jgi:hypothetical protein
MARNQVFRFVLPAAGVLVMAACASQPASTPSLLEKKFQIAAKYYEKVQHEGQTVYCKKEKALTSAIPFVQCLTEPQLRLEVENAERWRNPVPRPLVAGAGQGGIG